MLVYAAHLQMLAPKDACHAACGRMHRTCGMAPDPIGSIQTAQAVAIALLLKTEYRMRIEGPSTWAANRCHLRSATRFIPTSFQRGTAFHAGYQSFFGLAWAHEAETNTGKVHIGRSGAQLLIGCELSRASF